MQSMRWVTVISAENAIGWLSSNKKRCLSSASYPLSFSCQLTGKVNTLIFREYQYSWYNKKRVDFRNNRWTKPASWSLIWPICNWSMREKLACHNQYLISQTSNVPSSPSRLNFRLSWWACVVSEESPLLWTLIGVKAYPGPHVEFKRTMTKNSWKLASFFTSSLTTWFLLLCLAFERTRLDRKWSTTAIFSVFNFPSW